MTLHDMNESCKRAYKCKLWVKISVRAKRNLKENIVSEIPSSQRKLQKGVEIKPGPSQWI